LMWKRAQALSKEKDARVIIGRGRRPLKISSSKGLDNGNGW
jgi:hypothetical protein